MTFDSKALNYLNYPLFKLYSIFIIGTDKVLKVIEVNAKSKVFLGINIEH